MPHKLMKILVLLMLLFAAFLSLCATALASSVEYSQKTVNVGSNTIKLNILTVPNSPNISFQVVHSNPIGSVDQLKNLVSRANGIAGVNGTFFEAYQGDSSKRYPNGILIENNNLVHSGTNVSFLSNGQKLFGKLEVKITGAINGSYKWPNNWYAWDINHVYGSNEQAVLYTSYFGKTPDNGCINVVVKDSKVAEIVNNPVIPPSNGYVIHIGKSVEIKDRFKVGDSVEYKVEYLLDGKPISSNIEFAIGAGPKLLTQGKVDIDFDRDGFTEEKIKSQRSTRSFVGVNTSGSIIIGNTPLASIRELASALSKIGVVDAMNLDGGASSGLFFNGKYISTPGRLISNALVVVESKYPSIPIQINLNSSSEAGGFNAIPQPGIMKNDRTFVPLRGVLENLGIQVTWNGAEHSVTCRKDDNEITLIIGDGEKYDGFLLDSKSYVPLRLISEKFGYAVDWDSKNQTVKISS